MASFSTGSAHVRSHSVAISLALPYSRGADYSAVLPVGRHWDGAGETWTVLDLWRERMYRETDLLATLTRWHERYTVARIIVEQYGSTGVVEGALQARLPVETVAPTPGNQAEAFGRLFSLAKEGRLRIPAGATALLDELRIIRHTIGETGTPRFSAPGGRHDDTVFALAWAARAVASLATPGRWAAGLPVLAGGERATATEAHLRSGRGPVIESWDEKSIRIHEQRTRSGRPGLIL